MWFFLGQYLEGYRGIFDEDVKYFQGKMVCLMEGEENVDLQEKEHVYNFELKRVEG